MRIIGWVRQHDHAACGGVVAEGDACNIGQGRPYAYQGARLTCRKNCVILEGDPTSTINNRARVRHGMKTSAGCPLIATLNDMDGVSTGTGQQVAAAFFLNADSHWTGVIQPEQKKPFDERAKLSGAAVDGLPYFVRTMDGRTFSGRVGEDGLLARVDTFGKDEYEVYWGDEALAQCDQGTQA